MAIQITQDPINNFFDNLPRYALDLKQQDDTARFRDKQLGENIRQFNEAQLQQQGQFSDTLEQRQDEFGKTMIQRKDEFGQTMKLDRDKFGLDKDEFGFTKLESTRDYNAREVVRKFDEDLRTKTEKRQQSLFDYNFQLINEEEALKTVKDEIYTNVNNLKKEIINLQQPHIQLKDDYPSIMIALERMRDDREAGTPIRAANWLAGARQEESDSERIDYLVGEKRKADEYIKIMQNRTGQSREEILEGFKSGVWNKNIFDIPEESFEDIMNTDMEEFRTDYGKTLKDYQSVSDINYPDLEAVDQPNFRNTEGSSKTISGYYDIMKKTINDKIDETYIGLGGSGTKYDIDGREIIDITGNTSQKNTSNNAIGPEEEQAYKFYNSIKDQMNRNTDPINNFIMNWGK
tara:strand:+ start:229 stop:1440 length:1212 start_codon:yes stop_codon:yes gene_type:complete